MRPVRSARFRQARRPSRPLEEMLSAPPPPPPPPVRRRSYGMAILLACGLALTSVISIAGYRAWTIRTVGVEHTELQLSNEQRIALRYGDLRIPAGGDNVCTSFAFDNATGLVVDEREIACHVASEQSPPGWEHSGGTIARAYGMANGFKR
jgi:hypothetical protein